MIPLSWALVLAAALFAAGLAALLLRRNALVMLMGIEIMVNAANVVLVAASRVHGTVEGHSLVLFVIGVEAAELASALAVITAFQKGRDRIDMGAAVSLRDGVPGAEE
jgi:NADH-quinone oxidoreductase subunit K